MNFFSMISQERKVLGAKFFHQSIPRTKLYKIKSKKTAPGLKKQFFASKSPLLNPRYLKNGELQVRNSFTPLNSPHQITCKNNQHQQSPLIILSVKKYMGTVLE